MFNLFEEEFHKTVNEIIKKTYGRIETLEKRKKMSNEQFHNTMIKIRPAPNKNLVFDIFKSI